MSETVAAVHVPPGESDHADATWRLKERISAADGVLEQHEHFFRFQYQRCGVHLFVRDGTPVAFAIVRSDGYLSLLGVDPDRRRRGLGERLVERVATAHDRISCHTRANNEPAVAFYADLGFVVTDRIDGYYRDGTDALRLVRDDPAEIERILDVLDR